MTTLAARRDPTAPRDADTAGRTPPLVGVAWGLLIVNTLGSQGPETLVAIPRPIAQAVTMGSLLIAFTLALLLNPRLKVRPSAFLLLLTLLLVLSIVASARIDSGYGALMRCARLAMFLATLWLLSYWWRGTVAFVRYHITTFAVVLAVVVAGLITAPGLAMPEAYGGRLVGALWPMPPPQIAQYAAIVAGLTLLLWLGRRTTASSVLLFAVPALGLLLLTHTRTATFAMLAGLVLAVLSLVLTTSRARKAALGIAVGGGLALVAFLPAIQGWIRRGQDAENFTSLTGREKVWDALLADNRTVTEQLFGVGLTDKSFNGLPIDSGWLAVYHEQGLVGLTLVFGFLATLAAVAVLRPPSLERACAIFLIVYCLMASYAEVGLGDASPYLLHLAVAATLLVSRHDPARNPHIEIETDVTEWQDGTNSKRRHRTHFRGGTVQGA
ncbi:O-antigen ligase domain-containing protein [Haloechinothrix salitolerans]|uniref:O-antigen ligase family protein n=1 Tax=Haloechinothrix salitolerans TaxID=926830 RepID=A0ABW2C3M7_9PSEU